MTLLRALTTFAGRIPRSSYWLGFATVVVVFGFGRYLLKLALDPMSRGDAELAVMLWSALATVPLTALIVKRFNDRDRPGWIGYAVGASTALTIVAPYFGHFVDVKQFSPMEHAVFWALLPLSLFALVENGFLRGTPGPNRHGPDPSRRAAS